MTVDAPSQALHAFDQRFTKEYRYKSDHNGIQGYMVPYMIKAISEKLGKVDRKAFAAAIKDTPIYVRDTPGILIDTKFDANGDPDRVSYIAEVKDGKQVIIATLPPIRPF
jgi:branched-chain amino acid transport system substrate-binding protein